MKRLVLIISLLTLFSGVNLFAQDYVIHTVKWYEDISDISAKYGVPVDVIKVYNGLTSDGLEKRMKLKIPKGDYSDLILPTTAQPEVEAEPAPTVDLIENASKAYRDSLLSSFKVTKPTVSATLLLPINATAENPSTIALDFYSGSLLAARHLAKEGVNLNLSVHDVYGDAIPSNLSGADFIIGPFTTKGLSQTLATADSLTTVISPLDAKTLSLASGYKNFIQNTASQRSQYEDLVRWIGEDYTPADTVLVFYESGVAGLSLKEEVFEILETATFPWKEYTYNILDGREVMENLLQTMAVVNMNRVLVASENEAFVNDVVRNLNLLIHNGLSVTLYASSKVRTFETIEIEHFHNTNLHCSLSFYIDYDDPRVREFLMEYRALYGTEPSQTAFHGYDTTYYFSKLVNKYGSAWTSFLPLLSSKMLMSDFSFERVEGYNRTGVRRITYEKDYSVKLLK